MRPLERRKRSMLRLRRQGLSAALSSWLTQANLFKALEGSGVTLVDDFGPRDVQEIMSVTGYQLWMAQRYSHLVSDSPAMRPRYVDGPGCTPHPTEAEATEIIGSLSKIELPSEEDFLRMIFPELAEENGEVASIPVRRQVDGEWQTVMITRSEWEAAEGAG